MQCGLPRSRGLKNGLWEVGCISAVVALAECYPIIPPDHFLCNDSPHEIRIPQREPSYMYCTIPRQVRYNIAT